MENSESNGQPIATSDDITSTNIETTLVGDDSTDLSKQSILEGNGEPTVMELDVPFEGMKKVLVGKEDSEEKKDNQVIDVKNRATSKDEEKDSIHNDQLKDKESTINVANEELKVASKGGKLSSADNMVGEGNLDKDGLNENSLVEECANDAMGCKDEEKTTNEKEQVENTAKERNTWQEENVANSAKGSSGRKRVKKISAHKGKKRVICNEENRKKKEAIIEDKLEENNVTLGDVDDTIVCVDEKRRIEEGVTNAVKETEFEKGLEVENKPDGDRGKKCGKDNANTTLGDVDDTIVCGDEKRRIEEGINNAVKEMEIEKDGEVENKLEGARWKKRGKKNNVKTSRRKVSSNKGNGKKEEHELKKDELGEGNATCEDDDVSRSEEKMIEEEVVEHTPNIKVTKEEGKVKNTPNVGRKLVKRRKKVIVTNKCKKNIVSHEEKRNEDNTNNVIQQVEKDNKKRKLKKSTRVAAKSKKSDVCGSDENLVPEEKSVSSSRTVSVNANDASIASIKSAEIVEDGSVKNLKNHSKKQKRRRSKIAKGREKNKTSKGSSEGSAKAVDKSENVGGEDSKRVGMKGMIFLCNSKTKRDCYHYKILGLPASMKEMVAKIYDGMKLFLFDVDLKLMYGIYKAAGPGGYDIEPKAFNSGFPSQVCFTIFDDCLPLPEEKFKEAIKDNYYARNKFSYELTAEQVKKLCRLFVKTNGSNHERDGVGNKRNLPGSANHGRKERGGKRKEPSSGNHDRRDRGDKRKRPSSASHSRKDRGDDRLNRSKFGRDHPSSKRVTYERESYAPMAHQPSFSRASHASPLAQSDSLPRNVYGQPIKTSYYRREAQFGPSTHYPVYEDLGPQNGVEIRESNVVYYDHLVYPDSRLRECAPPSYHPLY